MAKLRKNAPEPKGMVVKTGKDKADLWYLVPVKLGAIEYRNNCWIDGKGQRYMSSWDALRQYVEFHNLRHQIDLPPAPPKNSKKEKEIPVKKSKAAVAAKPKLDESKINQLMKMLLSNPEVQAMLEKDKDAAL